MCTVATIVNDRGKIIDHNQNMKTISNIIIHFFLVNYVVSCLREFRQVEQIISFVKLALSLNKGC